ncbi:capsular polysaccharide synthesis protein [Sphaerochaeta sp.]|uniref:capsular polysaccharide synthesis protein n=1 Tax=Sphaerochaeta sp. TaxID=1972642 RepID=UPI002FCA8764
MMKRYNQDFIHDFGLKLLIIEWLLHALQKFAVTISWKNKLYDWEHTIKRTILRRQFIPILSEIIAESADQIQKASTSRIPKKIWVFWWQGNQKDIPLVHACISSIEEYKGDDTTLVVLTKENLHQYCTIPPMFYEKLENGNITLTHFSDIVRVSVLAEQGGVWLDATIFALGDFSYIFSNEFWTIRKQVETHAFIPMGRWSIYAMAAVPRHPIFMLMKLLFTQYWATHTTMLDYFLVDYCLDFLYEQIPSVKTCLDDVSLSNPKVLDLQKVMCSEYSDVLITELLEKTQLFKLSWKEKCPIQNNHKQTVFGWLLQQRN